VHLVPVAKLKAVAEVERQYADATKETDGSKDFDGAHGQRRVANGEDARKAQEDVDDRTDAQGAQFFAVLLKGDRQEGAP